ncbi:hypothetical protein R3P38DRAFT_3293607 [Favolaschia claudopus]|uniref:Protein kinase domain-containing protein n=1 Tax=Favolaschia claudopus TaxID=2862362 RepID=A0AAV9ZGY4_9AGAR
MSEIPPLRPNFRPDDPTTFAATKLEIGKGAFGTVGIVTAEGGTRVMAMKVTAGNATTLRKEINIIRQIQPHRNIETYFGKRYRLRSGRSL